MAEICIIGAGWAGLSAAHRLSQAGRDVLLIDKARGPGGRCSTRRQDGFAFDHGAQYFTARSSRFQAAVEDWEQAGLVAPWMPRMAVFGPRPEQAGETPSRRWVGTPGMNAVLKHLADSIDCHFSCRAAALEHGPHGWTIDVGAAEPLRADFLVLTAPPRQALELLQGVSGPAAGAAQPWVQRLSQVDMNPCWAVMLGYDQPLRADFDAAFDNEGPLAWMARNASKPGRRGETWLLHARADWSRQHLEKEPDDVASMLLAAFRHRLPTAGLRAPSLVCAHRWRYALAPDPLRQACLADAELGLILAGDWCAGNRIEGAWHSGLAAAEQLLSWTHQD